MLLIVFLRRLFFILTIECVATWSWHIGSITEYVYIYINKYIYKLKRDSPLPSTSCDYDTVCADSLVDATGQKVGLQCFRWGHCAMRSDGCCEYECVETGETTVTTTATSTPITECDNCDTTATTTQTSTPTTTEEEEEEEEHKSKAGVAAGVTIVILLLLGGGSAFYYRKTHGTGPPSSSKRKGKRKGSSGGQTNMENPLYGNEKGASEI